MKLRRRTSTSKKASKTGESVGSNEKDAASAKNEADAGDKTKRKKFGMFSKNKSNSNRSMPSPRWGKKKGSKSSKHANTPDTVQESVTDGEVKLSSSPLDFVVSVIPVGTSSEEILETARSTTTTTTTSPRNLLQQLDLVHTDALPDGTVEGTELVLPSPTYEQIDGNDDEKEKDIDDEKAEASEDPHHQQEQENQEEEALEKSIEVLEKSNIVDDDDDNEPQTESDTNEESAKEEISSEPATGDNETPATNDDDHNEPEVSVAEEGKPAKTATEDTPQNNSMVVEEKETAPDEQPQGEPPKTAVTTAATILSTAFTNCTEGGDAADQNHCDTLPETMGGLIPTTCQPIIHQGVKGSSRIRNETNPDHTFDEKSGSEFMHTMLNVGFTLISHISVDGDDSWVGRTVQMAFRPGVCSSRKVVQPSIEWKTVAGGKSHIVETRSLKLLNINAVGTTASETEDGIDKKNEKPPSNDSIALALSSQPTPSNDKNKDGTTSSNTWCYTSLAMSDGEDDDFKCFFTITGQDGEVNLFEALNPDDALQIVGGIRYNAYRLSSLLIEGNIDALLADFYDNSGEPEDVRLPKTEVMNRLSHAFFDGL